LILPQLAPIPANLLPVLAQLLAGSGAAARQQGTRQQKSKCEPIPISHHNLLSGSVSVSVPTRSNTDRRERFRGAGKRGGKILRNFSARPVL
jgi:hypothetical protein